MIDRYLDELARTLPCAGRTRRRIMLEAEDHLRESAAEAERRGASPQEAEAEAVRRFRPARAVARSYATLVAATALQRAALALVAGLVLAVPVAYGLSEILLPPATWAGDEPPPALRWKRDAVALLAGLAAGAAALAYGLVRLGRIGIGAGAGACAAAALTVAGALGTALAVGWSERVPGAAGAWVATGAATAALVLPGLALGAAALARRRAAR